MDEAIVLVVARDDAGLWVELTPRAGCGRCHEANGCGGGLAATARRRVRLPPVPGADVGDHLLVVTPESSLRRAALRAYGWPLVGALAGAIAMQSLAAAPYAPVLGALAGLALGFALARWQGGVAPAWQIQRIAPGTTPLRPAPACPHT